MNRCKRAACAGAAVLVFAVVMLLYGSLSFAPFGSNSLAWMDAISGICFFSPI